MPKRNAQPYSPFAALKPVKHSDSQMSEQPASGTTAIPVSETAKSKDPAYTKFTTYVQKSTHRAVKLKALEQNRQLSDLVEHLLVEWLTQQNGPVNKKASTNSASMRTPT